MNNLYLLPIFIALSLGFFNLIISKLSEKKMIDKPFENEFSNELYVLSFSAPFKWFINPNEHDKQVRNIDKLIRDANETKRLNYRVYITLQVSIILMAIFDWVLLSFFVNNIIVLIKILLNVEMGEVTNSTLIQMKLVIGIVLLSLSIIPKYYLNSKAKNNSFSFEKDLPILQLFIILMLKANRPLSEVLYVLSTTKTIYQPIFDSAYRIYIRDKNEGMEYLYEAFKDTKFSETINVLIEFREYSKRDTIIVLNNGLKEITEYTNSLKRKKGVKSNVLAQLYVALPFVSAILLGFGAPISYGLNLLNF